MLEDICIKHWSTSFEWGDIQVNINQALVKLFEHDNKFVVFGNWRSYWGPVQTDAFSFENANILLHFHVPSTRKRWKRCIVFDENANFWKRLSVHFHLKSKQRSRCKLAPSSTMYIQLARKTDFCFEIWRPCEYFLSANNAGVRPHERQIGV